MPASASTSPSRGRTTAMPPKRPASASTAERWRSGSIERADVVPGPRGHDRDAAPPGEQRAARRAGELVVELPLEAGEADGRARRDAAALEGGGALGRGGAEPAGDVGGERAEVGEPVLPLGERRPVAGEDGRARRHAGLAPEPLAREQPGEEQAAAPVDAGAAVLQLADGDRQPAGQLTEHARVEPHRHDHRAVARRLGAAGLDAHEGEHVARVAVGPQERADRRARPRLRRQQPVHRDQVAPLPRVREPLGRDALRRLEARARRQAGREGDQRHAEQHRGASTRREPGRAPGAARRRAAGGPEGAGPRHVQGNLDGWGSGRAPYRTRSPHRYARVQ